MKIVEKAEALLTKCDEIMLASVNENGYPRVCVVSKIKFDGIRKIWVTTGFSGTKTRHFLKNPKASVCFYKDGNSVTLVGKVTVKQDTEIRKQMWLDWFINHFPGGTDDPEYCVLEFATEEATFWIDQEFVTLKTENLR